MQRPRIVRGRPLGIVAFCVVVTTALIGRAADVTPYEAHVVANGASVHSGPGEKFYPTDTLAQGDLVEVYREKPGGWLGIRPTINGFSWVSGRDLKLREGGLGEVNKDDVASRIGSRLNDKHNASQVRLKKGEMVEVLGEESVNGETWYKIAPPAGEFRWIQSSLVERTGPIKTVAAESTTPAAPVTNEIKPKDAATPAASSSPPTATLSSTSEATAPPLIPITPPPSTSPAPANTTQSAPSSAAPPAPAAAAAPSAAMATTPSTTPGSDDLAHELAAIEVRLSRMATAPTTLWNTERLERDAAQLMKRAQTQADRDAVQATLNKINRFSSIARHSNPMATTVAQTGQPPITPLAGAATVAGAAGAPNAAGGPYDAVGILRPVVSRRPGAPQFALVDERGQVLTFVTPTPDVNLQAYLGQRVGVVGNRGYIAEFSRSHVTAARVTPLGGPIVR